MFYILTVYDYYDLFANLFTHIRFNNCITQHELLVLGLRSLMVFHGL